jgi:hypothetical protein
MDRQQIQGQASVEAVESSGQRKAEAKAGPLNKIDANGSVVILTYNVWFREDLQLQARMNAIGKIIQLHQPHVICLQVLSFSRTVSLREWELCWQS